MCPLVRGARRYRFRTGWDRFEGPDSLGSVSREPINGEALSASIHPWRLRLLDRTGSTNADAAEAARVGEAEGLVVVAEWQTSGRGRLGRPWISPPRGGLAMSVLLRPDVPMANWGWLPLLTGVALVEAIRESVVLGTADVGLKWPNDLLISGRKCAGILAEASVPGAVVIGIGVNVSLTESELPERVGALPATSLRLAGAAAVDRTALAGAVLGRLRERYERWRAGEDDLARAYLDTCLTIGCDVRILLPDGGVTAGVATGVDGEGRLIVRTRTGRLCPIAAGDVTHVR